MLIINKFKNRKVAMDYYNKIIADPKVFKDLTVNDYAAFAILDSNLEIIRSGNSFVDYMELFNKVYLY
jgi:hypothetical protein